MIFQRMSDGTVRRKPMVDKSIYSEKADVTVTIEDLPMNDKQRSFDVFVNKGRVDNFTYYKDDEKSKTKAKAQAEKKASSVKRLLSQKTIASKL